MHHGNQVTHIWRKHCKTGSNAQLGMTVLSAVGTVTQLETCAHTISLLLGFLGLLCDFELLQVPRKRQLCRNPVLSSAPRD